MVPMPHHVEQEMTPVEQLLVEAVEHSGDRDARERFTQALLDSTVLVPGQDEDDGFAPLSIPGENGLPAVAFFTSAAPMELALSQLGIREVRVAELPCREFWTTSVRHNTGTTLNPLSPYGKPYPASEMSDILRGVDEDAVEREMQPGETYAVREPADVPAAVLPALREHLGRLGDVEAASLAWMTKPDGLEGYLLVVRSDLPDRDVVDGVEQVVPLLGGNTLDVLVRPTGGSDDDPAPGIAPFYP